MERCYMDDISKNVMNCLKENHASAVQKTSGVSIISHIRNCWEILKERGWLDHFHWHPMVELCRLETLDEEETWRRFVGPYKDQDYARHQRVHFGRFFKRCCYLAKRDSFPCPEKFYWLAGGFSKEVWGIMMMDVLAVTDELKAAGRTDEALAFIRQSAPLYLNQVRLYNFQVPAEWKSTDEEKKEAGLVLGLDKEEWETITYWDDLYNFEKTCTSSPKGGWLKRWHDLGGKDFWEVF